MRKIAIFCISLLLVLSGLGVVTTISKELKELNESMLFSNLSIKETDKYVTLELKGADSQFLQKDYYVVPTQIKAFTFPFGTEITSVECNPKNIQEQHLTKEIMITTEPRLSSQINIENNEKIENPLSIDTWYDYRVGCGIDGKDRNVILKIQIFPVQYQPLEDKIVWAETVDIKIKYNEPAPYSNLFLESYDLIVLGPSGYSDELDSLISHKNNRGVTAKFVSLYDVYSGTYFPTEGRDNPEQIKYFIKNAIENWDTRFVLLVGGADDFPIRDTHVYVNYGDGDGEIFASDLYYADIYDGEGGFSSWDTNENDVFGEYDWDTEHLEDDVDLYPDVYLGRLACTSGSMVTSTVNKIITYETNEVYAKEWFTDLVVIGGDTSPNDEEEVSEGEIVNQAIIDIMDGFIPTKCWDSEGTLNTRSFINDAINSGAGFVDFSGHGNPQLWSTHPHNNENTWIPVGSYRNSNVETLINGGELPIVITGACSVAKFIERDDCFTWSFVSNPNGGGIAAVGPSALSWGYTTSYVIHGLGGKMQLQLFKAYKEKGALTFGEMWGKGISSYISPRMDSGDHKTVEEWQPFGDPSLAIAKESIPPKKPNTPEGPSSGSIGEEYTYIASTTDEDGDEISYLFDWGDAAFSEWSSLKNSGQTVSASHIWTSEGNFNIKVKAKDEHGVQSEWSNPLSISMPKDKSIQLPIINKLLEKFPILKLIFNL